MNGKLCDKRYTCDLLDMRTNMIEQAFIDGVAVELNGEQQALYRKFMKKYGLQAE
jgi:hypothetical protein